MFSVIYNNTRLSTNQQKSLFKLFISIYLKTNNHSKISKMGIAYIHCSAEATSLFGI